MCRRRRRPEAMSALQTRQCRVRPSTSHLVLLPLNIPLYQMHLRETPTRSQAGLKVCQFFFLSAFCHSHFPYLSLKAFRGLKNASAPRKGSQFGQAKDPTGRPWNVCPVFVARNSQYCTRRYLRDRLTNRIRIYSCSSLPSRRPSSPQRPFPLGSSSDCPFISHCLPNLRDEFAYHGRRRR